MSENLMAVQLRNLVRHCLPPSAGKARRWIDATLGRIVDRKALSNCQEEVLRVVDRHRDVRHVLVFAPSTKWDFELFQRPQQLATALARQGVLVFYMEPNAAWNYQITPMGSRLYRCEVPSEVFGRVSAPLVYILCWNTEYLRGFDAPRLIYDYIDELTVFRGGQKEIARNHKELVVSAFLTMATADHLYRNAVIVRPDCVFCPNGVDYDHFARTREKTVAAPPAPLLPVVSAGKPIIGYYGALACWFDYGLLRAVAVQRKDLSFVLIGPNYDNSFLRSGLSRLPNVTWLGVQPYADLPNFLRYFDVATIPFHLNKITHATSPLKLFEYMAGGKPVVATAMHETMRYEGVLVAKGANEFSSKLDEALKLAAEPEYLAVIDRVARENTWNARAVTILQALDALQKKRT
jgi:glycosyltransferase involved in cell wall biosynthesis